MKPRSTGPHTFVRYEGKLGTVAVVIVHPGRQLKVSASNLIPVDSQLAQKRHADVVLPETRAQVPLPRLGNTGREAPVQGGTAKRGREPPREER